MFDYFKQKGVNNLIWIWTTQNYNGNSTTYNQDTDWYPGTDYCDMVARDLYGYTATQNAQEFKEIQTTYPDKMVVLGECGWDGNNKTGKPQGDIAECWEAGAKWGHFMVWYDRNAGNKSQTMVSDEWWTSAMKKENADIIVHRTQVKY
jgi:beta-mannanase